MVQTLHQAVKDRNFTQILQLLEVGADVNMPDALKHTPLFYAVYNRCTESARILVDAGADVKAENLVNYTPLHIACEQNALECVKLLVKSGADINGLEENWGASPLIIAAFWNHTGCAIYLCHQRNIKVTGISSVFGYTALHLSAIRGNLLLMKNLVNKGAEIDACTLNGTTALILAVENEHFEVTKYLLEIGADMTKISRENETIIHKACQGDSIEILKILLQVNNRYVNTCRDDNNTPLHLALLKCKISMVKILLQYGAENSLLVMNSYGETPYEIAKRQKIALQSIVDLSPKQLNFSKNMTINKAMRFLEQKFPAVSGFQNVCDIDSFKPRHSCFMQILREGDVFTLISTVGLPAGHIEYYNPVSKQNSAESLIEKTKNGLANTLSKFTDSPKLYIRTAYIEHNFNRNNYGLLCIAIAISILQKKISPSKEDLQNIEQLKNNVTQAIQNRKLNGKQNNILPHLFFPGLSPARNFTETTVDLYCICHSIWDDTMKNCKACGRYFHKRCINGLYPQESQGTQIHEKDLFSDEGITEVYCPDCETIIYPERYIPLPQSNTFVFDAFVSFSQKDDPFIHRHLCPNLERDEGFQLFIVDINTRGGASVTESINSAICESRKCIAVVSSNYFLGYRQKFEWSHMMLPWSRYQSIMIILIESPQIILSSKNIPKNLRKFLRQKLYVEWREDFDSDENAEFWRKVKRFLELPYRTSTEKVKSRRN